MTIHVTCTGADKTVTRYKRSRHLVPPRAAAAATALVITLERRGLSCSSTDVRQWTDGCGLQASEQSARWWGEGLASGSCSCSCSCSDEHETRSRRSWRDLRVYGLRISSSSCVAQNCFDHSFNVTRSLPAASRCSQLPDAQLTLTLSALSIDDSTTTSTCCHHCPTECLQTTSAAVYKLYKR